MARQSCDWLWLPSRSTRVLPSSVDVNRCAGAWPANSSCSGWSGCSTSGPRRTAWNQRPSSSVFSLSSVRDRNASSVPRQTSHSRRTSSGRGSPSATAARACWSGTGSGARSAAPAPPSQLHCSSSRLVSCRPRSLTWLALPGVAFGPPAAPAFGPIPPAMGAGPGAALGHHCEWACSPISRMPSMATRTLAAARRRVRMVAPFPGTTLRRRFDDTPARRLTPARSGASAARGRLRHLQLQIGQFLALLEQLLAVVVGGLAGGLQLVDVLGVLALLAARGGELLVEVGDAGVDGVEIVQERQHGLGRRVRVLLVGLAQDAAERLVQLRLVGALGELGDGRAVGGAHDEVRGDVAFQERGVGMVGGVN